MVDATTTTTTPDTTTTTTTTPAALWYEGKLDAELVGYAQNKAWKLDDPGALAVEAIKAARSAQQFVGLPENQLLRLPKDAGDEAGWKGVYSRLGVPSDAKEYDFAAVKHADGKDVEAGLADALRAAALSARVPKDRAGELVSAVVKHLDATQAEAAAVKTAELQAENAALEKSWGANRPANMLAAQNAMKAVAMAAGVSDADAKKAVDAISSLGGIGAARVLEMFRVISSKIGEETFHGGADRQTGNLMSREAAMSRKSELMADTAWGQRYTSGGAAEMREMMSLNAIISGDDGTRRAA